MKKSVAIAGGGLAGLTTAKLLIDNGFDVSLYEALPYLGGRASTYKDAEGDWIEQGLHLFLGTYSEFKKILKEIGQAPDEVLFWMDEIQFRDPNGDHATYGINPLRSPLKSLLSLSGQNDFLDFKDKLTTLPIAAQGVRTIESLGAKFDQKTVYQLWSESGATEDVLERFLRPFCRAIQFTDAQEFSAYNFLGWIHNTVYDIPHSLAGGYRGPRDETIFQPFARYLRDRGARIHNNARINSIEFSSRSRKVKSFGLEDGQRISADIFVMALPSWIFAALIPDKLAEEEFFQNIRSLPTAPAIAVQLWFDRPVAANEDFVLVPRSDTPVYQEQGVTYRNQKGTRISITISPAEGHLNNSDQDLVDLALDSLRKVEPATRSAQLLKSVVLKHEKHLLKPLPGVMSRRPSQVTPIKNFFLAGDWTQQDYFGSQEGAVRSGCACAEQILRSTSSLEAAKPHAQQRTKGETPNHP